MKKNSWYKENKIFAYLSHCHRHVEVHERKLDEEGSSGINEYIHVSVGEHKIALIALKKETKERYFHYDRDRTMHPHPDEEITLIKASYKKTTCFCFGGIPKPV